MDVDTNFETCLFLSSHKLVIGVYEKQSLKKLFYNEIQNNQNSSNLNHELLNNFLEKNIFDVEKGLKGFIENIYEIAEYKDGIIMNEDFSGNVIFNVKYYCKLCLPVINTIIIGQIKLINQELIIANNGPMYIFITNNNVTNILVLS